jgi:hypothetical protein
MLIPMRRLILLWWGLIVPSIIGPNGFHHVGLEEWRPPDLEVWSVSQSPCLARKVPRDEVRKKTWFDGIGANDKDNN